MGYGSPTKGSPTKGKKRVLHTYTYTMYIHDIHIYISFGWQFFLEKMKSDPDKDEYDVKKQVYIMYYSFNSPNLHLVRSITFDKGLLHLVGKVGEHLEIDAYDNRFVLRCIGNSMSHFFFSLF